MRAVTSGGIAAASLGAVLLTEAAALAGGFQIRTHSARAFGMSIAGVAAGDDLSYAFWNPAALGSVETFEVVSVANGVFPSFEIRPSAETNATVALFGGAATDETDVSLDALVPASYAGWRVGDRLTVGMSVTSPFGLATKSPFDWAGQVYSRTSRILSVNLNPMASFEVTDRITLGGGVMVQHFDARLSQATGLEPGAPSALLTGDDLGVGFNVGARVALDDATVVGLGYRSGVDHGVEGELDVAGFATPVEVDVPTPGTASLGLRRDVTDRARVLGTVEWTDWSRLGVLPVLVSGTNTPATQLILNYRDGFLFSVGGEYDWTDAVSVRAGYGYEIAPLDDTSRDTRLPEVNQNIFSTGLTYAATDRFSMDLAYTYSLGVGDGPISIGPDDPRFLGLPFAAESDLDVQILSLAVNFALR